MTRRSEREAREARAIAAVVDGVLANWGIEVEGDWTSFDYADRVARQIGPGEAVEYSEIYGLLLDVGKEVFTMTGKVDVVGIPTPAELEVQRLREIIKRAYGAQGWDIGSMKNLLIPGLEGYENSGWARS